MSLLSWLSPTSWIASAVNAVGGKVAESVLQWHKESLDAANNEARIKADLASKEIELQRREAELRTQVRVAIIGRWYEPENLACYIFVSYLGKCVVWDTMLGLGTTPELKGLVGEWLVLIAVYLFGKKTVENITARVLASKSK